MNLRVIITGGTFDKRYDAIRGQLTFADTHLPDIVSQRLTDLDRRLSQLEKAAQGDIPPTAAQIAARQRK